MLASCNSNTDTEFPPGLEPLETDTAPPPVGTADDPLPETLSMVSGRTSHFYWTHARGYVHAPLVDLWRAFHDPNVGRDPTIDDYSTEEDVEPDVPVSYVIHYTVHDFLTIEFEVTWRFGINGEDKSPTMVAARFQKTWGTTFIQTMEGSIVATAVDDETSEVELIEHLDAVRSDSGDCESFLTDVFDQLLHGVHGGS